MTESETLVFGELPSVERIGGLYLRMVAAHLAVFSFVGAFWVVLPVYISEPLQREFRCGPEAVALASSASFLGWGLAAPSWGALADRRGRRAAALAALGVGLVASVAAAAAPTMPLFGIARLALGVALGGTGQTAFAYVIEVTPSRLRGAANNVVMAAFAVAEIALALLALLALERLRAG